MPPDRALEIVFEMRDPVARLDQRRSTTDGRIREPDAVVRSAEADLLLEVAAWGRKVARGGRGVREIDRVEQATTKRAHVRRSGRGIFRERARNELRDRAGYIWNDALERG